MASNLLAMASNLMVVGKESKQIPCGLANGLGVSCQQLRSVLCCCAVSRGKLENALAAFIRFRDLRCPAAGHIRRSHCWHL